MKRQSRSRNESPKQGREYRDGAMARSRSTEPRTYHMRRRSRRVQAVLGLNDSRSPAQRFWDEHAVKAGMAAFWTWFIVANWSKFPRVLAELTAPLMGS